MYRHFLTSTNPFIKPGSLFFTSSVGTRQGINGGCPISLRIFNPPSGLIMYCMKVIAALLFGASFINVTPYVMDLPTLLMVVPVILPVTSTIACLLRGDWSRNLLRYPFCCKGCLTVFYMYNANRLQRHFKPALITYVPRCTFEIFYVI